MTLSDLEFGLDGSRVKFVITAQADIAEYHTFQEAVAALDPDWVYSVKVSAKGKGMTVTLAPTEKRA